MPSMSVAQVQVALLDGDRVLVRDGALPEWTYDEDSDEEQSSLGVVGADVHLAPTYKLGDRHYLDVVGCRTATLPDGDWVSPSALTDPLVREHVERALAEQSAPPALRPEWFRRSWYDEVEAWVDAQLAAAGRPRTGPMRVHRVWSISAVLRVPTDAGEVWFKQASELFRAEAAIHQVLSRHLPDDVPVLVAAEADRCWMLMAPLTGTDADRSPGAAEVLATRWAQVQLSALDHLDELVAAGAARRDAAVTITGLHDALADDAVMSAVPDEQRSAVVAAARAAEPLVEELWSCGLPDTLSHGDLHLGNVAYDGASLRVFDLTDVCVSHPLLDGAHLAHFDSRRPADSELFAAFVRPWREAFPEARIDRAAHLAPLADLVFQIDTFHRIQLAAEPASQHELGITPRLLGSLPGAVEAATRDA